MSAAASAKLLRPGLLEGVSIMLAHAGAAPASGSPAPGSHVPPHASLREALGESARVLAAGLRECPLPVEEEALAQRLSEEGTPDMLVVDAAGVFTAGGEDAVAARDALGRTMRLTWEVTRTVAAAMIERERPGRIVLVAPPERSGGAEASSQAWSHAGAARAGLENLARTTSIEWSRYRITTVAIAPGLATPSETLAALCTYLASPAGAYFSGCVLALDGEVARAGGDGGAGGATSAS